MLNQKTFPLDAIPNIKANPQNFRLLTKIPIDLNTNFPLTLAQPLEQDNLAEVIFFDSETTGLDPETSQLIELSMVKCTISLKEHCILSIDNTYTALEDPQEPLSPFIKKLTHLSDDDLKDKEFNQTEIANFIEGAKLIIAHNCKFDEEFFRQRFYNLKTAPWACTAKDINWSQFGFNGFKLEYLLLKHGYFYEAHRALNDALAITFLMHCNQEAFEQLLIKNLS